MNPSLCPAAALLLLLLLVGNGAASQQPVPASSAAGIADLHWQGERAEVLAATGRRLFAGRLEAGLGFCGSVGYGDLEHGWSDPLRLVVFADGRAAQLERVSVDGYASHQLVRWKAPDFELLERKYITDDDELIDELELVSTSDTALDLELHLSGSATPQLARLRSKWMPLSLAGVANLAPDLERELAIVDPRSASLAYDGVDFQFARARGEPRPAFMAVRGGGDLDATWKLPRELSLPVPDVAPAIATLHLLAAAPAPRGRRAGAAPAHFRFHFEDGTSESLPWPSIAARLAGESWEAGWSEGHAWHLLLLPGTGQPALHLAYVPPPGRFIERLELLEGEGLEVPVLLAATLELPPAEGRPAAHVGRTDFLGEALHLALAGQDFVPIRDDEGRRVLLRAVHLEPRATARVRAVLSTGPQALMTVLRALDRAGDEAALARQQATQATWFEEFVPRFTCSDRELEAAWLERWHLVRRSMLRLDRPEFSLPVFYAGLDAGQDLVSPANCGRILPELRWLRDLRFAQGQLRALCKAQLPGQQLTALRLGQRLAREPHSIAPAALGVFEVSASRQFLAEVWPSLVADFDATWDSDSPPASAPEAARQCTSARALASGLEWLGRVEEAARLTARAESLLACAADGRWGALEFEEQGNGPEAPLPSLKADESMTGARFESAWADLVVRLVAGLVPSAGDELEFWPRVTDLEHFRLRGLVYHGHSLDVIWDRPDGELVYEGEPEGFSALVDGRRVFLVERLERVRGIPLDGS